MRSLKLGHYDQEHKLEDIIALMGEHHKKMARSLPEKKPKFRDDGNWFNPAPTNGDDVKNMQRFLKKAGFMPFREANGIFDYFTLASIRLFQEYVRSVEGIKEIGRPDGNPGSKTFAQIKRWKDNELFADWGLAQKEMQSPEDSAQKAIQEEPYNRWLSLMDKAKAHYENSDNTIIQQLKQETRKSDTLRVEEWDTSRDQIHLIGIRRNEDASADTRVNDDIFVLLVNGMVFQFWGSTDPSASLSGRTDEAFLVEGQHRYRYGWHKVSNSMKIYKALEPASNGVLIYRDQNADNALTESDLKFGLQKPNPDINIHWSGVGSFNFSAGCQVIAGMSYINHLNHVVDCSAFASKSYSGLRGKQTKGAYNVIADLILAYSPKGVETILYTLIRE